MDHLDAEGSHDFEGGRVFDELIGLALVDVPFLRNRDVVSTCQDVDQLDPGRLIDAMRRAIDRPLPDAIDTRISEADGSAATLEMQCVSSAVSYFESFGFCVGEAPACFFVCYAAVVSSAHAVV